MRKRGDFVREADIVRAILTHLKKLDGCFCWKEHGGPYGTNGIPDIICCYRGRFFGFEVKTEKGKPTKLQEAVIRQIKAAEGTALIVHSVEDVKAALAVINEQRNYETPNL